MSEAATKTMHIQVFPDDHGLVRQLAVRKKSTTAKIVRDLIAAAVPNLPEPDRRFLAALAAASD